MKRDYKSTGLAQGGCDWQTHWHTECQSASGSVRGLLIGLAASAAIGRRIYRCDIDRSTDLKREKGVKTEKGNKQSRKYTELEECSISVERNVPADWGMMGKQPFL